MPVPKKRRPPRRTAPAESPRIDRPSIFDSSRPRAADPEIVASFRDAAHRYAAAEKARDRDAPLEETTGLWKRLRDRAEAAERLSPRFPDVNEIEDILSSAISDDDPKKRRAAVDSVVSLFEKVHRGLDAIGTPAEPGARWRPAQPPLPRREKEARLREVQAQTRKSARSLADAVRKVVAARRERGVALYSTVSNEAHARYAVVATEYALGLVPAPPLDPGTSKRTAPWGVFKIRSDIRPEEAADRFAVSPPLPARAEMLEARSTRIQLEPLHRRAPMVDDDDGPEDDDADR